MTGAPTSQIPNPSGAPISLSCKLRSTQRCRMVYNLQGKCIECGYTHMGYQMCRSRSSHCGHTPDVMRHGFWLGRFVNCHQVLVHARTTDFHIHVGYQMRGCFLFLLVAGLVGTMMVYRTILKSQTWHTMSEVTSQ